MGAKRWRKHLKQMKKRSRSNMASNSSNSGSLYLSSSQKELLSSTSSRKKSRNFSLAFAGFNKFSSPRYPRASQASSKTNDDENLVLAAATNHTQESVMDAVIKGER